jgi:hypothetical protein
MGLKFDLVLDGFQELGENHLDFQAKSHPKSCRLSLFLREELKTKFPNSHYVENLAL